LKFTVLLPTRERADTLHAALRTCTSQDHDDLEIIVSDNFSTDPTREVVASVSDPRVRYLNTGRRISMTENWEFALSHVQQGYVTVVGDDDGLLPGAVEDVAGLIRQTQTPIVSWLKAEYCWPDHPIASLANHLVLPLDNQLVKIRAAAALRDTARFWLPYNRTPTLYNSFVDVDAIQRARSVDGTFFRSIAPDVYSGIVLLSVVQTYLYSLRPFSLNGASPKSTGTSGYHRGTDSGPINAFFQELGSAYAYEFGHVKGSVMSVVAESLFQANRHRFGGGLRVSERLVLLRILAELSRKGRNAYAEALAELLPIARQRGLERFTRLSSRLIPVRTASPPQMKSGLDDRGCLTVDCAPFGVRDVYDASVVAAKLLGSYAVPPRMLRYSAFSRIKSRIGRFLNSRRIDRTL
jgi:glycosyltransferase involved in cell wall biosynthesis